MTLSRNASPCSHWRFKGTPSENGRWGVPGSYVYADILGLLSARTLSVGHDLSPIAVLAGWSLPIHACNSQIKRQKEPAQRLTLAPVLF
jgi:hypothetical protein